MQVLRGCVAGCVALLLGGNVALADKKDDAIKALQGKWQATQKVGDVESKAVFSFEKDNKLTVTVTIRDKDVTFDGKYDVIDEKTIEVTLISLGRTITEKRTFKITGDTLELTDTKGKTEKFTRVK